LATRSQNNTVVAKRDPRARPSVILVSLLANIPHRPAAIQRQQSLRLREFFDRIFAASADEQPWANRLCFAAARDPAASSLWRI
jgi:hypothetical protein